MGGQCLLILIGLKALVMMNSLQNIVISGAQDLLMLMGSKFLIKMTRPQNTVFILMFCELVIFIKNFNPINIRKPWAHEITTFCSEFIMTKAFKPIKTRRHWPLIWFHIFFSKACFGSWLPPFHTWGVFDYISLGMLVPNSRDRHEKQWRPDFTRHKTHPKIRFVWEYQTEVHF